MTLELHTVSLKATDGISPVVRTIASNTQSATNQMEQSFERTTRSTERFSKAGAALGTALGSGLLLFGEFGRAAAEEEAIFARLEQSVTATGKAYLDYSDKIDQAIARGEKLAFSDDQVADALSRMTTTTGDAQAALDNIGLAMDLSRARGIDLSTAADLIGKAYTGNFATLARFGIQLDANATSTEALAAIQAKTAGQAIAYSETQAASIDRARNALDNYTESLGAHAGQVSTLVALLPGLTSGWAIFSGAVGGIAGVFGTGSAAAAGGAGATGALATFGAALVTVGGAALIAAPAIAAIGYTAYTAKDNIKAVTEETKALTEALNGLPTQSDDYAQRLYGMFSQNLSFAEFYDPLTNTTQTLESTFDELTALRGEYQSAFLDMARSLEIDFANPAAEDIQFLIDQLLYFYRLQREHEQTQLEDTRAGSRFSDSGYTTTLATNTPRYYGDVSTSGYNGPFQPAPQPNYTATTGDTAIGGANGPMDAGTQAGAYSPPGFVGGPINANPQADYEQHAAEVRAYNDALKEQLGLYYPLVEGINSADDAQGAFYQTQQYVVQEQGVYSQQQGEYEGQMSALEAGYKILQDRQAEGIPLTKEEQDLLNNYPELYGRLEGGSEDAAVAQALLAAQYAENMKKGDELNRTLEGNTEATGDLVDIVQDLILSLDGIPEEVRSRIEIENAQETLGELQGVVFWLNQLHDVHFTVSASGNGISLGNPDAPGIEVDPWGRALGGMIPGAAHGRVMGGGYTLVGEAGPELIAGGQGGMVIPASATRAMRQKGGGGGDTYQINGPVNVYANDPRQFGNALREQSIGSARQ